MTSLVDLTMEWVSSLPLNLPREEREETHLLKVIWRASNLFQDPKGRKPSLGPCFHLPSPFKDYRGLDKSEQDKK